MRNRNVITAMVVGGLTLAATYLKAQSAATPGPSYTTPQTGEPGQYVKDTDREHILAASMNFRASTITGLPVRNDTGERLGRVQDLVVDLRSHAASLAIVAYGGTLGVGETRVAVPLTDLEWSSQPRELILRATRQQFESAASAPTGAWAAFAGQDWAKSVDRFYGEPSQASPSRFERQEITPMNQGREPVRSEGEPRKTTALQPQPGAANPESATAASRTTDEALITQINDLIRQEQGGQRGDIQVKLKEGVVTLSGEVRNQAQKRLLESQIKVLPGVDRIEDHLVIQSE